MSKKNLSKSTIEGGRTGYNKQERRESSQQERSNVHTLIAGSHGDSEVFDEVLLPKRKKIYKVFRDKLHPVRRWMDDRVGKSWNKTYSLLKEKFDSRTTSGRHIVYDHILGDVWMSPDRSDTLAQYHHYYVDHRGILRKMPSWRQENAEIRKKLQEEKIQIEQWLNRRMIGKVGNVLYWYEPTILGAVGKFDWWYGKYNDNLNHYGNYDATTRFLRRERLNGQEIEFFTKLVPHHKEILLKHAITLGSCQCIHTITQHLHGVCQITSCKCELKWI